MWESLEVKTGLILDLQNWASEGVVICAGSIRRHDRVEAPNISAFWPEGEREGAFSLQNLIVGF